MINFNLTSACSIEYVISLKLHEALITGNLPEMNKYKKIPCWNVPGVWLARFRIVYDKNIPKLSINFIFYSDLFIDPLLVYLIGRHKFKESIPYNEWGSFYTFIDKSLGKDKKGLIKDLVDLPNNYNEYLHLDKDIRFYSDINYFLKKYIYIKDVDDIIILLLLAFKKYNISFINKLSEDYLYPDKLKETGIQKANLLNDCLFVIKDINNFINTINKEYSNVTNQGVKKWRGLFNSMDSFLGSLDLDFRLNLQKYNIYHINKGTIHPKLEIPKDKFTYKNIHMNLGISRW